MNHEAQNHDDQLYAHFLLIIKLYSIKSYIENYFVQDTEGAYFAIKLD